MFDFSDENIAQIEARTECPFAREAIRQLRLRLAKAEQKQRGAECSEMLANSVKSLIAFFRIDATEGAGKATIVEGEKALSLYQRRKEGVTDAANTKASE